MTESLERHIIQFDQEESIRLDRFLAEVLTNRSRSRIQSFIKDGLVTINGEIETKPSFTLASASEIEISIPPATPGTIIPEDIPLDIVFENDDVIVVNKPAKMVVHPSHGHQKGTLVHALMSHHPFLAGIGGVQRPGIVHRLDRDTSGVILIAKNEESHRWLQHQFKTRKVRKEYLALVEGKPPTPKGRVEAAIQRDPSKRKKMAIAYGDKGKMAISEYETVKEYANHTLLKVIIQTGRTHQIRLHMDFLGCPIVGDTVYGYQHPSVTIDRQFLHAHVIQIKLPGEKTPRTFSANLPAELEHVLSQLIGAS